ncbi:MAG: hypothetical protein ACFFCK_01575 [Promethearchaeota archaeon]
MDWRDALIIILILVIIFLILEGLGIIDIIPALGEPGAGGTGPWVDFFRHR